MQKVKGPQSGHPIFLFAALFKVFRFFLYGLFIFFCLNIYVQSRKKVLEQSPPLRNTTTTEYRKPDITSKEKKEQQKEKEVEQKFKNLEGGINDLVTHDIKHLVKLGDDSLLFQFPKDRSVFDVGFLLIPFFVNERQRRWQSSACDDAVVVLQLRDGNLTDSFVIFEHVIKYGQITPIKWRNIITYPAHNVRILFVPKTEKGRKVYEQTKLGFHDMCGQVLVHGSFGFIYKGGVEELLKKYW